MASRNTSPEKALQGIGQRLRQVRDHLELSQPAMAAKLGLPPGTYQAYEQGRNDGRFTALIPLVTLGIDVNWLLTGAGWMHRAAGSPPKIGLGFNERLLKIVVSEIETILDEADAELTPDKKAELVAAVYEMALENEGAGQPIDRNKVVRLVRLAG